ncbi:MAG: HAMP domain-containing sensor histidine kinase [Chloroflexota bacterium]|nr:HAMP domain-containing sensor histidine kinase [Chloroflexota bacterium]
MWQQFFNTPYPDADNILPASVQVGAAARIRSYWIRVGWQVVFGECILWLAAVTQEVPSTRGYALVAGLMGAAYLVGVFVRPPRFWLIGTSALFLAHGMLIGGLGAVTALTFTVPYTCAGMLLSGRARFYTQAWCTIAFWISLIYGILPTLPQLQPPNYILISYDILLAVFTFQTLRFLNHLTVEVNSAYVTDRIRGQSQQVLARVSHELRTPLNSILGFAKLLRRADLSETHAGYLRQIIEEGDHLNRLVSDLLDSAHLASGKMTLNPQACDLNALCASIIEDQRPTISAAVTLTAALAPDLPPLHADPVRLRQAISNLVSNAIKYTPHGTITLTTARRDAHALIAVRDTGIGIPDSQHTLIFLPFVQLDSQQVGVGLGLDIAAQIVRLHGGALRVESQYGVGSTFTIELPIA